MEWIKPGINIDFIGKAKPAIALSVLIIAAGIVSMAIQGLNLGIDFSGGTEIHVRFTEEVSANEIRAAASKAGRGDPVVQSIGGGGDEFLIRVPEAGGMAESPALALEAALKAEFGEGFNVLREELVGPQAGRELRAQGIYALLLSFIGILIYVGIRFDFRFGVGSILAIVHDTLIVFAALSLTGKEITLTIIAAVLTVIGYSINDTVIIFDRIRENMRLTRSRPFGDVVNRSINETLARTLLTSFTLFIVVIVLFLFGGSVLHDFAFVLLIGVVTGTYSTIFIATPLLVYWQKKQVATAKRRR